MRSTIIVSALAGLAVASPLAKRQAFDFDAIDSADPVELTTPPADATAPAGSYDADAAAAAAAQDPVTESPSKSKVRRDADDCQPQPKGFGPVSSPDDGKTFLADPQFPSIANAAVVPDGYSLAFSALQGATQSPSYITYKTMKTYNTIECQQFCDAEDSCFFFNVYMERDPSIKPAAGCTNPTSITNYKCALFGAQQTNKTATNRGQWRQKFQVAIVGSNGFNKLAPPAAVDGFTAPVQMPGAINAPDTSYMGAKYYSGPYNPSQCAKSCLATTAYNKKTAKGGDYDTCSFFNSYVLSKNGAPQGTYCGLYSSSWDKTYATNLGQYRGKDQYSVSQSYGWTLSQA